MKRPCKSRPLGASLRPLGASLRLALPPVNASTIYSRIWASLSDVYCIFSLHRFTSVFAKRVQENLQAVGPGAILYPCTALVAN
ncbi:hypothetical protein [Lelliottia amnigena]|uniref:hypothetical protein n=1 Tax=Lelliottia amnigena TaxID=61646 RepID=UPI002B222834|nr:hypothetical protein [Lelliottia amnigena]MEA9395547.1 hypothetical protein [Lelliottia amnigena]